MGCALRGTSCSWTRSRLWRCDLKSVPTDLDLYEDVVAEAKQRFAVWPSAYASGWVVQQYKRRGGKYVRRNGGSGDYMALPSVLQAQEQMSAVVDFLVEAQRQGRPVEDWVESKITSISKDTQDVFTYAVYGERARQLAPRQNPPLRWHLKNDDVSDILLGLLERTGRTEDLLAILAEYYVQHTEEETNPQLKAALRETARVLAKASMKIEQIFDTLDE